jgi:hypothetical protein
MRSQLRWLTGAACAVAFVSGTKGEEHVWRSGPAQVAVIELFSSEGCSSCPPAEAWLGKLRAQEGLWTRFVPVAFHVSYWDELGWRDPWASADYTRREYAYAAAWHEASVYTPCFVRNGAEWRPGTADDMGESAAKNAGQLTLTRLEDGRLQIEYQPAGKTPAAASWDATVVLLGGGVVSTVSAGENAGRKLPQEFVVLKLATAALTNSTEGSGSYVHVFDAFPKSSATPRRAIAAWVSRAGQLAPVQAVGGWLETK